MNEQQNVNTSPKPKKKRSFWWLKLLLILILFAAGVIAGMMLSSETIAQRVMQQINSHFGVTEVAPAPVATVPAETEAPIEFKPSETVSPKPSKAPVEIVSPEAKEKEEAKPAEEDKTAKDEAPVETAAVELAESPVPSDLPVLAPVYEKPVAEAAKEPIGIDAALEAALKHADLDKSEVVVYGVSREKDDGVLYYEVEFGYNGREYEYEVNAYTGVVESWKGLREKNGAANGAGNAQGNGNAVVQASAENSDYVSAEQAKKAALKHAGYEEHETTDMKTELELYGNKVVYDVEFWAEGYDYEYKVCAQSGQVLMVEKERD